MQGRAIILVEPILGSHDDDCPVAHLAQQTAWQKLECSLLATFIHRHRPCELIALGGVTIRNSRQR